MRFSFLLNLFALMLVTGCTGTPPCPPSQPINRTVDPSFLNECAFVSVDIQEGTPPVLLTDDQLPTPWRQAGFTAEDVNAANDFSWNIALPNAVKVANACRELGIPMIFIHWGYEFENGMDLDPDIRKSMLSEHGEDYSCWSGYIGRPDSQVAKALEVRDGEYVLAKTAQDAFTSCNIQHVLQNLGIKRIIFVGGHTGACLGKTATSARRLGYETLCVSDATNAARESSREQEIADTGYDYVITTSAFLDLLGNNRPSPGAMKRPN